MKIGILGIGKMGGAMAERLVAVGEAPLLWNRSPNKAEAIAGASVADTPAAVAQDSDVVISALANDAAIATAYFGPDGLLSAPLGGTVVVETCTTSPETAQRLDAAVTDAGGLFLECPVGGTIGPARDGALLGLAGGSDAAFAKAQPVLDHLTRRLEHLGPVGTGAAMKLAINLPLMVYWAALGEALGLVLQKGIDPAQALDILADSSGAIGAARKRIPPIRQMLETGEPGPVSFSLANALKDMKLMEALAEANGRPSPVITAARTRAEAAAADGFAEIDCSMVGLHGQTGE